MSITIRSAQTIRNGVTLKGHNTPPNIVTNGIIAYLDAGLPASYSGTGSTWHDLSGQNANATINGSVVFTDHGENSYFTFDGNSANCITSDLTQDYQDCTIVFYPDFTWEAPNSLPYGLGAGADRTMRFGRDAGAGNHPWQLQNPGNNGDWAYPNATTYYVNNNAITSNGNLDAGWNILGAARTNQWGNFAYSWGSGYYIRAFKGAVAAILLYNRVLTAEEQMQNYDHFKSRYSGT